MTDATPPSGPTAPLPPTGLGCAGGQRRFVTPALDVAEALAEGGWQVSSRHRELERRAEAAGAAGVRTAG